MSEIPQWAKNKAVSLGRHEAETGGFDFYANCPACIALARYISEHEEPPVDPLLIEAREIAASDRDRKGHCGSLNVRDGLCDRDGDVELALAALKRGIEIGKGGCQDV